MYKNEIQQNDKMLDFLLSEAIIYVQIYFMYNYFTLKPLHVVSV